MSAPKTSNQASRTFKPTWTNADRILMVALTAVIAWSAWNQSKYAEQQTKVSMALAARLEQQDTPTLLVTPAHWAQIEATDELKQVGYSGFACTNVSPFDITVTSFEFLLAHPNRRAQTVLASLLPDRLVISGKFATWDERVLPHRLQRGDHIQFLYSGISTIFERHGGVRVQPVCRDSFGNSHSHDGWIVWEEHTASVFAEPYPVAGETPIRKFNGKLKDLRVLPHLARERESLVVE